MIQLPENSHIEYLVGQSEIDVRPMVPYNDLVCEFLNEFSSILRKNRNVAKYPDIATFSFWCRKANVQKMKSEFHDNKNRIGRGLAFHITPSNVPINFAFSLVFSMLAGNANIVRTPSKKFPQIDIICNDLNMLLSEKKYHNFKENTVVVRYKKNDEITGEFSKHCDARVIWGGNSTIFNIRKIMVPARCIEIAFSDRYSICVLNAQKIIQLDENNLEKLATQFYNDTYLMDQNACSSPRLVIWLGKSDKKGKEVFWQAVSRIVEKKYHMEYIQTVDKYMQLCRNAIDMESNISFKSNGVNLYRISLEALPENKEQLIGKFGYFYEFETSDINSISHLVDSSFQTLTYFGFEKKIFLDFIFHNRLKGIDRVVPVGKALDIGPIWDGYDVIGNLSRIINIQ